MTAIIFSSLQTILEILSSIRNNLEKYVMLTRVKELCIFGYQTMWQPPNRNVKSTKKYSFSYQMLCVYNVWHCPCRNSWPCVCNKNLRNVLSMQQTLYLFTFKWKVLLENQILFSVTLFTKTQHKTFKASTAKQNMEIFFYVHSHFF